MRLPRNILLIPILVLLVLSCKKFEENPAVKTLSSGNVTSTGADLTGEIIDLASGVFEHGFCWSESRDPTVDNNTIPLGPANTTSEFTGALTNLDPGTTYYFKAFCIGNTKVVYGDQLSFTTIRSANLTTTAVSSITGTTALSGGNISDDGGSPVSARGVCWSTSSAPTIDVNPKTSDGTGKGNFTSNVTGLQPGTKYYVRAYAINGAGQAYGNELSFTTIKPPVLTTSSVTSITSTSAVSGGNITSDGGSPVTARGVCWSTSSNPTVALTTKTSNGTGPGVFSSNMTGLQSGKTYHVRAYATNSAGTSYGSDLPFNTPPNIVPPTVTTGTTTATSSTTATSGGNVTADGGAPVTVRGVCWSTIPNPTVSLSTKTTNGTGTGLFTSSITGLAGNSTYHVRAYATNSAGTSYGNDLTFITPPNIVPPTVTTGTTTATSSTTATSGGNVTADGGAPVTARGVCWSTSPNPTTTLITKTSNGAGTGSFTSNITGLQPGTRYYVRAYATNTAGTTYGNELSLTTDYGLGPEVSTAQVIAISTNSASSGGNVIDAGDTEVFARGVCWSIRENPTLTDSHTNDGSGTGAFTSALTGLSRNTTYYVRAYATNYGGTDYGVQRVFTTYGVIDYDGNGYRTVVIGNQEWMAENLKTTRLNDGSSLPYVTDNILWNNLTTAAYCWYNNDPVTYKTDYGALYNWYAAYSENLCPVGWHVPSLEEWYTLIEFVGGSGNEGGKLKEYGTNHWLTPNTGATDEYGFTALPGGVRYTWDDGTSFRTINTEGNWANSTLPSGEYDHYYWIHMQYNFSDVSVYGGSFGPGEEGFSIRCTRD